MGMWETCAVPADERLLEYVCTLAPKRRTLRKAIFDWNASQFTIGQSERAANPIPLMTNEVPVGINPLNLGVRDFTCIFFC